VTSEWTPYYEYAGDDPRETLLGALDRFAEPGLAVDLGCGSGRDTFELLRRGWRVLAIDAEREAIERLLAHTALDLSRLETQLARFEDAAWPDADLVSASFALPFCRPEHFRALWERVVASLRPGARFCGQLFGDRDEWASTHAEMTFHTRGEVERLLSDLDVEELDEAEEDGPTALEPVKHWHVFHVVARRPLTAAVRRPAALLAAECRVAPPPKRDIAVRALACRAAIRRIHRSASPLRWSGLKVSKVSSLHRTTDLQRNGV